MTGVRLQYIKIEIRKWISYMRRKLLGLLLMILLIGTALCGAYLRLTDTDQASVIKVALVVPGEQEELQSLTGMLRLIDSIRAFLSFVYPDADEVDALFESGDIQAAIYFGEDFIQDVTTGVNTPIRIRMREGLPEGELLEELLTDLVTLVDVTEAASYTMIEAYDPNRAGLSLMDMENRILEEHVRLFLSARKMVSMQVLSPTGEVSLPQYYATISLLLFMLLPGAGFYRLYDPADCVAEDKLRIYGVGSLFRGICKLLLMSFACVIFASAGIGLIKIAESRLGAEILLFSPQKIPGLFGLSLAIACFFHGMLQLSGESREREFIGILAVGNLSLLGGCIVPVSFLPEWAGKIAAWTPFNSYRVFLESILYDGDGEIGSVVLWSALFLLVGEVSAFLRRSHQAGGASFQRTRAQFGRAFRQSPNKLFGLYLFVKWQCKRLSPVFLTLLAVLFLVSALGISFPREGTGTILLTGDEELCLRMVDAMQKNSHYVFEYRADEGDVRDAVVTGQVLAGASCEEEEITMYMTGLTPGMLVAKETIATAAFLSLERDLMRREYCDFFGSAEGYDRAEERFQFYLSEDGLFRMDFEVE